MRSENIAQPAAGGQHDIVPLEVPFKFLNFIFHGLTGYVEFRFFGQGPKPRVVDRSCYHSLPLDEGRIFHEVLSRNGTQMITYGPGPRCRIPERGSEGKDRDVLQVGCIWADLDYKQAERGAIEVIQRIKDFPLRPSVVVNSGYGRHVYFVFNSPLRDSGLLQWDELIKELRNALGSDAVTNLSRVLRLPGTLNIKESMPVPCEICEEDSSWVRYAVEEVREAIEQAPALNRSSSSQTKKKDTYPIISPPVRENAQRLVSNLREHYGVPSEVVNAIVTGQRIIRTGINAGRDDDESARDFWIICTLLEKGIEEEDIQNIFRAHPHGCGSKWAQKAHGERYLELTLGKARAQYESKTSKLIGDHESEGENTKALENGLPPHYSLMADGSLWFCPPENAGVKRPKPPENVCDSLIRIIEIQENLDTGHISVVIEFSYLGRRRTVTILRSQMVEARQLVAALGGEGAPINSNNARRVLAYLVAYEHTFGADLPRKRVTSRFGRGRANGPFFLPGLSSEVEFAPSGPGDLSLYRAYSSRRGTLQGWAEIMQAVASETLMIPQIAIITALVPPLQSRLMIPNFVLDINGNTSTGKSTTLKLAASVYGRPNDPDSLLLQWNNTKVAIEQVANMCSELPIFLDDAQHCSDELKKSTIYMIANGRGKGRGSRGGGIRETPTWHTVALSTSEEPLHESSPHEGARGRILPVGGATPPFRPGMASLVQALEKAIASNHGHAGELYIRHLNGWADSDWTQWGRRYSSIRSELLRNSSSDLVGRVSGYIAAIQLVAEIACPLLNLKFKPDVVAAWLMLHLDEQQSDQNLVLLALRALADHYVSNLNHFAGDGRYDAERPGPLYGSSKRREYVGFLRSTIDLVFKQRKWNQTAVLNKMAEAGALHATEEDRHTKKVSVEGVKHRMVCIKWSAILPEDIEVQSRSNFIVEGEE